MPNLINLLREQHNNDKESRESKQPLAAEERQTDLEGVLQVGMEWGTCFVFSCEKDCCAEEEGWNEELVLVQWDE